MTRGIFQRRFSSAPLPRAVRIRPLADPAGADRVAEVIADGTAHGSAAFLFCAITQGKQEQCRKKQERTRHYPRNSFAARRQADEPILAAKQVLHQPGEL